jgi:diguanylate cyclase (GGDEF)-like protein
MPSPADTTNVQDREEFRHQIGRSLEEHADAVSSDAASLFPFAGVEGGDRELAARLASLILQLLIAAVRDAGIDPRSPDVSDLRRIARDRLLPPSELFGLVYLLERAALDELALDESFGATSEPWPAIARLVRRSSFAVLASFAERLAQEAGEDALTDALTTLHTRPVLLAALEKEIQRSERFGHPFALIVFDVDHLADINAKHGYGLGDRVLERIGIVLRNYFREQDWVTRCAGDRFAVLLPETQQEHAAQLAERVRVTVEDRLALRDHRSDAQVPVTVSVGMVSLEAVDASVRADAVLREAEQAVNRAKLGGRNRVERVDINVKASAPPTRDVAEL